MPATYKYEPHIRGDFKRTTDDGKYDIEWVPLCDVNFADTKPVFKYTEMVNLGRYFANQSSTSFFITPEDYVAFTERYGQTTADHDKLRFLHYQLRKHNASDDGEVAFPYALYACSRTHAIVKSKLILPYLYFHSSRQGDGKIRISVKLSRARSKAQFREHNIPILREMHEGNKDTPLRCKFTGALVEDIKIKWRNGEMDRGNSYDFHHILVDNGISVHKTLAPGEILRNYRLDQPKNRDKLIDFMRTVVTDRGHHNVIHRTLTQGIERYYIKQRPWVLKNKRNFNKFCKKYNLLLNYEDFILELSKESLNGNKGKTKT